MLVRCNKHNGRCALSPIHIKLSSRYFFADVLTSFAEKFRFSAEFIELHQRASDVFLNRIANHPHLRSSEDFHTFLEADEEFWVEFWVLCYLTIEN